MVGEAIFCKRLYISLQAEASRVLTTFFYSSRGQNSSACLAIYTSNRILSLSALFTSELEERLLCLSYLAWILAGCLQQAPETLAPISMAEANTGVPQLSDDPPILLHYRPIVAFLSKSCSVFGRNWLLASASRLS